MLRRVQSVSMSVKKYTEIAKIRIRKLIEPSYRCCSHYECNYTLQK